MGKDVLVARRTREAALPDRSTSKQGLPVEPEWNDRGSLRPGDLHFVGVTLDARTAELGAFRWKRDEENVVRRRRPRQREAESDRDLRRRLRVDRRREHHH